MPYSFIVTTFILVGLLLVGAISFIFCKFCQSFKRKEARAGKTLAENLVYDTIRSLRYALHAIEKGIPKLLSPDSEASKTYTEKRRAFEREIQVLHEEIAEFERKWVPLNM